MSAPQTESEETIDRKSESDELKLHLQPAGRTDEFRLEDHPIEPRITSSVDGRELNNDAVELHHLDVSEVTEPPVATNDVDLAPLDGSQACAINKDRPSDADTISSVIHVSIDPEATLAPLPATSPTSEACDVAPNPVVGDPPTDTRDPDAEVANEKCKSSALQGDPTCDEARCAPACSPLSLYKIKTVKWRDSPNVPIVTQNENGPCPLIAIVNVLLLKGKMNPFAGKTELTADDLVAYLGDCILQSAPKNISEGAKLNYEQNMQDAFSIFHKLQTGLDVNVKFTGVRDFEYTPECIVFDLLNIPLYHGWLVDPQAQDVVRSIGKLSYNQLVEKIITNKASPDNDLVTEALIAENFLERSASQLTYYGLYEINAMMKSDELGILFRNNHFSTIFKHKDELFQLVTDQGFLSESNVIWETLCNIEGDGLFVDSNFVTVPPKPMPVVAAAAIAPGANLCKEEQIQQDFLVALSIQEEQKREEEKAMVWQEYKEKELGATAEISDEELAWRLHTEEQKQVTARRNAAEGERSGSATGGSSAVTRQQSTDSEGRREPQPKKKSDIQVWTMDLAN